MSLHDDDPRILKLRELPPPKLDPAAREQTRRLAARAFAEASRPRSRLAWISSRALVAAVLALSAAVYVTSAVNALGTIYVAAAP
jgi:hypothetical protein